MINFPFFHLLFQEERDVLNEKLLRKDKTHAQELRKLQSKISSLEKELAGQQVNLVNIEEEMSERWKISIQKLHQEMAELSNTITKSSSKKNSQLQRKMQVTNRNRILVK